jgi:hypothetical protein
VHQERAVPSEHNSMTTRVARLMSLMFYRVLGCHGGRRRGGGGRLRGGDARLLLLNASRPGTREQDGQGWFQGVNTASEGVVDANERVGS